MIVPLIVLTYKYRAAEYVKHAYRAGSCLV